MDLVFSPDEQLYRDAVREFVSGVLTPLVNTRFDFRRTQTRAEIDEFRQAISQHEVATTAPVREDDSIDLIAFGIFIEEVLRLDGAFASLAQALFFPAWDMASLLVTEEQQRAYGHLFARGAVVSMGLIEPNAGSNPSQIETTAQRSDDGWVINGRKLWTSHAAIASGILVAARKVDQPGQAVSLFLLDADKDEYEVRTIDCLGADAIATCEVMLDEVSLPAFAEMTPEKGGLGSALHLVEQGRLKIVFQAIGVAQAALDLAVEYAKVRTQSGRPIASFQLVQQMLADMATEVELSRLIAYRAAVRVASRGIQVHGEWV